MESPNISKATNANSLFGLEDLRCRKTKSFLRYLKEYLNERKKGNRKKALEKENLREKEREREREKEREINEGK